MLFHCFAWNVPWKHHILNISVWASSRLEKYFWITHLKINVHTHVAACVSLGEKWKCFDLCQLSFFCVDSWPPTSWIRDWYSSVAVRFSSNAHLGLCLWCLMWLGRALAPDPPEWSGKGPATRNRYWWSWIRNRHQKQRSEFLSESYWVNIPQLPLPMFLKCPLLREVSRIN